MRQRPTRATTAGRAYLELRRRAREQDRPTAEFLQLYALEGMLARLHKSPHANRFVLKGGVLLAAFDARRPTKDVDLSATGVRNDPDSIRSGILQILEIELDDGLCFDRARTKADVIRESDNYSGVRVSIPCRLASAQLDFHVDVNVGDPIVPAPIPVSIPRILGGDPILVQGYPVAMVLAEKIVTMIQRGSANTRWRDFVDVATLTRRHALAFDDVHTAIQTVAVHRAASVQPLRALLSGFADRAQRHWSAWHRRRDLDALVPQSFDTLLADVLAFTEALLSPDSTATAWDPGVRRWN